MNIKTELPDKSESQTRYLSSDINPLTTLQIAGNNGQGVCVAVIDGRADELHPVYKSTDVIIKSGHSGKTEATRHGTAVCGIISSIAPAAQIINIPVFHQDRHGSLRGCSELRLAGAISDACRYGCHIINISGASLSLNGRGTDQLRSAVSLCEKNNILVIAAVGNDGVCQESVPAALDTVVAVGASDNEGRPAMFNNSGPGLRKKMLLAPGVSIPVAGPENDFSTASGSSFSAPVISGVAALIRATLPDTSVQQIRQLLFSTATLSLPDSSGVRHRTLNLAALYEQLRKIYPLATNRRKNSMSEEEHSLPVTPVTSDERIQPSETESPATALVLPDIKDPAPANYIHARSVLPGELAEDGSDMPASGLDKVFAIGTLGYDFGTEARLDYFTQVMGVNNAHPFDPVKMSDHLTQGDNSEQSDALIWTLKIDGIPVYAIRPSSRFAIIEYARLVKFLKEQETEGVERISIAGVISGESRLFNGQYVPTVIPVLRGMFNWRSKDIANRIFDNAQPDSGRRDELINFVNRIYYELRNRGHASHERAINFAATNAGQMKEVFEDAFNNSLFLNQITAVPSPVSRPESDCWDVVMEFFNPKERLTVARKLYRYTIDVSDVVPVTIGDVRSWNAY
ncbi:TPA: PatA/PatG family cyanobactin maturation protease [Salmonella enterica subsp. enterica serovar Muenchen]|nr:PatA/PatG family cyanobactin maturation protease [Salmonella enterica]